MGNVYLGDVLIAGEDLLPASNYIRRRAGDNAPIPVSSSGSVAFPNMSLCVPDGRNEDTDKLINRRVDINGDTYTLINWDGISTDGSYPVFFRELTIAGSDGNDGDETEVSFMVSPLYQLYEDEAPTGIESPKYSVYYLNNNTMNIQDTLYPNFDYSKGVLITEEGIATGLGSIELLGVKNFSENSKIQVLFKPDTVIGNKSLFTTPFAEGTLSGTKLSVIVYSTSYKVAYNPVLYTGAYTQGALQEEVYSYILGDSEYQASGVAAVGVTLYEGNDYTDVFGVISEIDTEALTMKVIDGSNVEVYNGPYTDASYIVYQYTLGSNTYYSQNELQEGSQLFLDKTLNDEFGFVGSLSESTIAVLSEDAQVGYVGQKGDGYVTEGVTIYTDSTLQDPTGYNATSNNAIYSNEKPVRYQDYVFEYNSIAAQTDEYLLEVGFDSSTSKYWVKVNNAALNYGSNNGNTAKGLPYVQGDFIIGGEFNFLGSFNMNSVKILEENGGWEWNGVYDLENLRVNWQKASMCKVGTATVSDGKVTQVVLDNPMEILKVSDLKKLSTQIAFTIGTPQFTLNFKELPENCVWLEGQALSVKFYPELFNVYGYTYGKSEDDSLFYLPDFRNRTIWGAQEVSENEGYSKAGVPNITGKIIGVRCNGGMSGAFKKGNTQDMYGTRNHAKYFFDVNFNAANGTTNNLAKGIYRDDVLTVQPPAVKVRVFTRYR